MNREKEEVFICSLIYKMIGVSLLLQTAVKKRVFFMQSPILNSDLVNNQ
jgi:hypothetical protein